MVFWTEIAILQPVRKPRYMWIVRLKSENITQPKKLKFSTNEYRFYRSSASMRRGHTLRPFISDWLMFKKSNVIGWWVMNLVVQVTHGYRFDKTYYYKSQKNEAK